MRTRRQAFETTAVTLWVLIAAITGANAAQEHAEVLASAKSNIGEAHGNPALLGTNFHDFGQRVDSNAVKFQLLAQTNTVVNGRNVTRVRFGRKGKRLGFYRQTGPRQWQEIPAARGGRRFNFTETNRDDWSVYLHDRSRNVRIQLDLHTKKVMYSDAKSARRPLYDIQGSSAKVAQAKLPKRRPPAARPPQQKPIASNKPAASRRPASPPRQAPAVNGCNVTEVTFGRGSQRFGTYTQTGNRQWQEIPARGGRRLNFTETNRDDWSVYLHDRSRNVRIQLDLHTKKVMYSDARSARRPLYEIQGSSKKAVQAPPPNRQSAGTPQRPPPRQAPAVNGRNVTEVTFGRGSQRFGTYTQTGNRQWQEIPARGGRRLNFTETNRDDWSVYLHDRSRNVRIQLDLHTKKVMYSDARSARRRLYEIQGSSKKAVQAPPPNRQSAGTPPRQAPAVNGRNVTEVTFGRGNQRFGTYTQTGNRQWQEIPARGGRRLNFTETNRDAWSVYLHDRSRNVRIQLDLHTKKVMYSDAKSARRPLYEIQGSSKKAVQAPPPNRQSAGTPPRQAPAVNGRNVTEVTFGRGNQRFGTYTQTGNRQWQEIPARGGRRLNFTETNRDAWSVYLHDRSRNVRIQLDLHTKKVMYSDAKSARRPLYDIQGSSVKVAHAQQPSPQSPGAPPPQAPAVNGRNVTEVAFGRGNQRFGTYTQTGNRQWLEVPAARGNPRHNFAETNRDDWSVYLSDRSRNVHLQLNLHTKKVMYSDARSSRRPLYDIQGTSAKAVQAPPPRSTPNQVTRRPPATTERDYPGGFVEIRHEGGYVAQFTVKYEIAQGSSGWRRETWKSGKKTLGYKVTYNFPTGSRNISIKGSNDTGLIEPFGAPHKTVLSKSFKLAPNKCYKVYGTTLHPGNGTCKPDVINTMTRAVENASRTYRREIEAVANHLRTITRTPNIESIAKSAHDRRDFTELARLLQLDTLTAALQGGQRGDLGGNGFALKGDGSAKVRELPPWRIGRAPLQARHGPRLLHLSAFQPEANGMVSSPSGNRLNLAAGGNTFNAISWAIAVADVSVLFGATGELGVIFPNGGSESPAFYLSGSWTAGLSVGADVGMGIGVWKSNVKGVAGKAHGGNVAGTFGPGIGVTFWFGYDGDFSGFQVNVVAGLSAELEYVRGVTEVF